MDWRWLGITFCVAIWMHFDNMIKLVQGKIMTIINKMVEKQI